MKNAWPIEAPKTTDQPKKHSVGKLIPPLIIGGIAGGLFFYFDHTTMAKVVWGISGFLFLCGLFAPAVFSKIEHGFLVLGHWVGITLTFLLLVPFYLLVFVPGRLMFKLSGKDPMTRACPTDLGTYWVDREPAADPRAHFERQY